MIEDCLQLISDYACIPLSIMEQHFDNIKENMNDHKSFRLDYPLTSCGVRISGILFMVFEYMDNGLVKIIDTIDAG